jgi:SAM-dependent methyltransferase
MSANAYRLLAVVYDEWQERYGSFSQRVLERLEPLLAERAPAARSFADIGCGTGTLLLALARHHPEWRLTGVDASDEMLSCGRGKPNAERVHWQRAVLGQPRVTIEGGPYDAIGSFFNTVNHLPDVATLDRAFATAAAALAPGGLLIFDVNNTVGYEQWWRGLRDYRGADWRLEMETSFDAGSQRARAQLRISRRDQVAHASIEERLFSESEIGAALGAAGLRVEAVDPWSPTPDDAAGATWWIARRPSG